MCLNSKKRFTAKQALNHPWVSGNAAFDTQLKSTQMRLKSKWKVWNEFFFLLLF
jgi:hypothetical protein